MVAEAEAVSTREMQLMSESVVWVVAGMEAILPSRDQLLPKMGRLTLEVEGEGVELIPKIAMQGEEQAARASSSCVTPSPPDFLPFK